MRERLVILSDRRKNPRVRRCGLEFGASWVNYFLGSGILMRAGQVADQVAHVDVAQRFKQSVRHHRNVGRFAHFDFVPRNDHPFVGSLHGDAVARSPER